MPKIKTVSNEEALPKPYYEREGITIYHGSFTDILPKLVKVNAVVTDPPYGVGLEYASYDDSDENWYTTIKALLPHCRRLARFTVMPVCRIDRLGWWYENFPPDWLISWHKGNLGHRGMLGFNTWEPLLCWGKPPAKMHDHIATKGRAWRPDGGLQEGHPCPKPVKWAEWLCQRASVEGGVILDPFLGSGTTAIGCLLTDRKCIGVEMEESYCELSAKRCDGMLNVMYPPQATAVVGGLEAQQRA